MVYVQIKRAVPCHLLHNQISRTHVQLPPKPLNFNKCRFSLKPPTEQTSPRPDGSPLHQAERGVALRRRQRVEDPADGWRDRRTSGREAAACSSASPRGSL
uniref:Uncharacterized protein n=1 Tax=Arundo donax TaxID=35708 RepID=A0A0A9EU92_ARUDO